MPLYEIAFRGECLPGHDPDTVKADVGRLFRADAERTELLFSGRRLVLKAHLELAAAERFRQAMAKVGAWAQVEAMPATAPTAEVEAIELAAPPAVAPTARAKVVPRDNYMAAFAEVDAPAYEIAEPGALMQPDAAPAPAPRVDLSGLSLAPVGAELGSRPATAAPPPPDTSHLKLA
ncbi:hypothetical protein [Pseudomonas massiliensis]|uniref:hypothetical protein n=1 Tax=Pseudomonas massiliensis TaxID=522492 RepID=UPI0005913F2C|nr:hypothetical protein [Pseudomonas massiliensis]